MNKKYDNKYIIGLDIGISSVGWGLLQLDSNNQPFKIIDVGSRIFSPGEVFKTGDSKAKERREKRGARRIIRRRQFRVDRVRNLLFESKYIKGKINSNLVSERNEELTKIFNEMINNYYKLNHNNPYQLKVEALQRKLSNEELSIILVHYAKKRGYKSNRDENNSNDKESGKVLSAIKENTKLMAEHNYKTISEMYLNDEKFKDKIKNGPNDYKISVSREMYLDEIKKVLDSQIKYGTITNDFKEKYLNIWQSQRHYASGPGYYYEYDEKGVRHQKQSPYGGNLIEKMTGKCKFDNLPRAPKMAFSSEIFIAITKLLNTRYCSTEHTEYTALTKEEIQKIIELAKNQKQITYKNIISILNQNNVKFKDLQLSKKKYITVIKELKKKLNIPEKEKIDINNLNDDDRLIYNEIYEKELIKTVIIELNGYHKLKDCINKAFGKEKYSDIFNNFDTLDELALLCTNYKLNDEIKNKILESKNIPHEFSDDNFIQLLPNFKDHLMLSTELIRKLIPLMLEGKRYDQAMEELGYNSSNLEGKYKKKDLLVPIYQADSITNQRVIRALTQARKVLNAIIKKYGTPYCINIETARELAKTKAERREIENSQKEKYENNENDKAYLVKLGLFDSNDRISSTDLLKYHLWKEQKECCAYSQKHIEIEKLFQNNYVQIDHILPYSRTFNDNYLNKTLVITSENQNKRNQTPYEWFGKTDKWTKYETFINSLSISPKKKDNYLLKKLDFDLERQMQNQNLNDTKYISKEFASLIKAHLNVEKVNVYQGAITAKLRARWNFNRLTHSYISKTYFLPDNMKTDIKKDRDNHLHHAIDALVIAATTPSLQRKITLYEQFSRYIDGKTQKELSKLDEEEIKNHKFIEYNEQTGEINDIPFKEYLKKEISENHIYYKKNNVAKLQFPLPYENFDTEAKVRVYERDLNIIKHEMKLLSTYSEEEINNLKVLIPSIAKNKISGKMHEETYYGIKKTPNEIFKTSRKPISMITKKDIESIIDKKGGSKDIYNTILEWLGNCKNGEQALKEHNGQYPINPNDIEKKQIKKIKIYEPFNNTGHMINNSNVEKGGINQIAVFKSKDKEDNKLYFSGYDILDIENIKAKNKGKSIDFFVKLEYAQGKNLIISYDNLLKEYNQIMLLNKNNLVRITNYKNQTIIAYIVGFSGGKLEVKSPLGDGYDLIGENKIFNNKIDRYLITVSTISKIDKLTINTLGEINGL